MRTSNGARAMISVALLAMIAASAAYSGSAPVKAQVPSDDRCAALAGLMLDNVEITRAELQPANQPVPGAFLPDFTGLGKGPPVSGLPAFCRVAGTIRPEARSDIRFEVWLPREAWNGRFAGVGVGGFAGSISYYEMAAALKAGQATAATDTGHQANGMDSTWARGNPAAIRDYGWRAIHLTAVNAKRIVADYYGRPADKSIFNGCSGGGRQALIEASRFPEDYDGIIAGAPASRFTQLLMSMTWTQQVQLPEGAALKPEQAGFIGSEVRAQCDALDGQTDGSIADPRQCRFDVSKLACGTSSSPQCLSPAQVAAVSKMMDGPRNSRGRQLAFPYSMTASIKGYPAAQLGWEGWIMRGGKDTPANSLFPTGMLRDFVAEPFTDMASFNWDHDPARLHAETAADLDAGPDMRRFFARGGKLIMWHGWADAAIPAEMSLGFYNDMLRASGPRARQNSRLFLIPEMQHCAGGTGASTFGHTGAPAQGENPERHLGMAMQQWVEKGRAPESVIGSKGFDLFSAASETKPQRLHCAWPKQPVLTPGADPDKAASYSCKLPLRR
ncbi:MAG: tannase/feruloyl esterase family alpha/beta hydrolase [Novosphingobium sp.]